MKIQHMSYGQRIRELALSFPATYEDSPWGHPVFKVGDNKMFAAMSDGDAADGWSNSVGSGTGDSSISSLRSSSRGCSLSCSVMKVVLPDNSELEPPQGATGLDAARAIGPKLADEAVLVRSNGRVQDLR